VGVKFIRPNEAAIQSIAADMRQADIDEVWASNHHTPLEALNVGWETSKSAVIVAVNDEPCVMIGLVKRDILSDIGTPWLLGTNNALKYKRHFIKQVPDVISEMLTVCSKLCNYVHVNNTISINWLKRIGFTIDSAEPYGYEKELFHRFHLDRENYNV